MRQMFQKPGYFLAGFFLVGGLLAGCEKIENTPPSQNDSLAVIRVGPGTRPDVIVPPDTPRSLTDPPPVDSIRSLDSTTSSGVTRP